MLPASLLVLLLLLGVLASGSAEPPLAPSGTTFETREARAAEVRSEAGTGRGGAPAPATALLTSAGLFGLFYLGRPRRGA